MLRSTLMSSSSAVWTLILLIMRRESLTCRAHLYILFIDVLGEGGLMMRWHLLVLNRVTVVRVLNDLRVANTTAFTVIASRSSSQRLNWCDRVGSWSNPRGTLRAQLLVAWGIVLLEGFVVLYRRWSRGGQLGWTLTRMVDLIGRVCIQTMRLLVRMNVSLRTGIVETLIGGPQTVQFSLYLFV